MSLPHLVLLPGLDGTGKLFAPLLKQLPSDSTTSVVSYPENEKLSYTQLKPYVMKALPVKRPYVLLAESFSGPLAIAVASTQPDNLQGLVLCASFVSNPVPPLLRWIYNFNRPVWFRFRLPHSLVRHAAAMWDCEPSVIDSLIEHAGSVLPEVLSFRFAQVMRVDVRQELQSCRVPLLYLQAKRDLLVQRRSWEEIVRLYPQANCVEIDASHFVLQHKPVEALRAIEIFLAANAANFAS